MVSFMSVFCSAYNAGTGNEKTDNGVVWYHVDPPVQKERQGEVLLPAARDWFSCDGIPIRVLFNHWVRDPYILNAPDGYYYMVGTTERTSFPRGVPVSANANGWWFNDGVRYGVRRIWCNGKQWDMSGILTRMPHGPGNTVFPLIRQRTTDLRYVLYGLLKFIT